MMFPLSRHRTFAASCLFLALGAALSACAVDDDRESSDVGDDEPESFSSELGDGWDEDPSAPPDATLSLDERRELQLDVDLEPIPQQLPKPPIRPHRGRPGNERTSDPNPQPWVGPVERDGRDGDDPPNI
jgi:hypothetical protein